jgi:hypothetical protein
VLGRHARRVQILVRREIFTEAPEPHTLHSTKGFVIDRQGLTATPWALGPGAPLLSASGKTFVATGASGTDTGFFALSFLSGNQAFLERGKVAGATDTHVYFIAADGLCEIGMP